VSPGQGVLSVIYHWLPVLAEPGQSTAKGGSSCDSVTGSRAILSEYPQYSAVLPRAQLLKPQDHCPSISPMPRLQQHPQLTLGPQSQTSTVPTASQPQGTYMATMLSSGARMEWLAMTKIHLPHTG
jgi:hypothetical protein